MNVILDTTIVKKAISDPDIKTTLDSITKQKGKLWLLAGTILSLLSSVDKKDLNSLISKFSIGVLSTHSFDSIKALQSDSPKNTMLLNAAENLNQSLILTEDIDFAKEEKAIHISDFDIKTEKTSFPFVDLATQQNEIIPTIEYNISQVLRHGRYVMGPEIAELEKQLSEYVGAKHTISCASGTDALFMMLMAYDIGPGDAIFTTPFTFIATAEVISLVGATPVFVDIDERTFNIDPQLLEDVITKTKEKGKLNPKAIMGVDLFGLVADYEAISKIAQKHNLFVWEDAAQSVGAEKDGKMAGNLAMTAGTSFFPAKPLGAYGDGGAIFTNDDNICEKLKSIRVHGQGRNKYENIRIGINGRLDTMQAAVLLSKLTIFPEEIEKRQEVASTYSKLLKDVVTTPYIPKGYKSAWAQYSILSDKRELCQKALKEQGIPTAVYYPIPLHLQQAFANLGYKEGDFPISEAISKKIFSIPIHAYLREEQINKIAEVIQKAV